MPPDLTPDHKVAAARRLTIGMRIFVATFAFGIALLARGIQVCVATNQVLPNQSILLMALGVTFMVFSLIGFRAFLIARRSVLEEEGSKS